MKDRHREEPSSQRSFASKTMFALWLVSSIVFVTMVIEYTARHRPAFEVLEIELPWLTVAMVNLGQFLSTGLGALIALVVQGVTLLPFARGSWSGMTKFYCGLAILGLLAIVAAWAGLIRPIGRIQDVLFGG